ncbi:MAG: PEGA domain-containing protein [Anaerotignaceae bacterium]
MGNYNFEDNNSEFDKTVRIEDINNEVRKIEDFNETKEFSNKPEKEPEKPQEKAESVQKKSVYDYQREIKPELAKKANKNTGGKLPKDSVSTTNMIKLSVIGGIIAFACIFVIVFINISGTSNIKTPVNDTDISDAFTQGDPVYAIVTAKVRNNTIEFYNINDKKNMSLNIDSTTAVTNASGGTIVPSSFEIGSIITIEEKGETGIAGTISIPKDIWEKKSVIGAKVDLEKNTIIYNGTSYSFGDDSVFLYDGQRIFPGDIEDVDVVTLTGKNTLLFVAKVEKGHGYITLKNHENIEELEIVIDGEKVTRDEKTGFIVVSADSHTITCTGKNIEDLILRVNVRNNENVTLDLNEAVEKQAIVPITLNVNQSGYGVFVDGIEVTADNGVIEVEQGQRVIEVTKEGYERWKTTVAVDTKPISLNVELKQTVVENSITPPISTEVKTGKLTIYSDPGWATIYVNDKYIGVAPVLVSLEYGEYTVKAVLEGEETETIVDIDSADEMVTLKIDN